MTGADLPEPIRPKFTEAEQEERILRLFKTLYLFIAFYSVLHKVLIPYGLSFTKLHPSPYTIVDYWFVHPVLLAYFFYKENGNSKIVSLLAGAAVTYGLLEVIEVLQGHYVGWLSFSRVLSSTPMALLSLFMLTRNFKNKNTQIAWAGALILLPFFYAKFLFPVSTGSMTEIARSEPTKEISRTLPVQESPLCGAMQLVLKSDMPNHTATNKLEVKECGIAPTFVLLDGKELTLSNHTDKSLNLHLGYYKNEKVVTGWNVLLPPGQSVKREVKMTEDSIAVIYSDSVAEVGITAISTEPLKSNWILTRKPLTINKSP